MIEKNIRAMVCASSKKQLCLIQKFDCLSNDVIQEIDDRKTKVATHTRSDLHSHAYPYSQ